MLRDSGACALVASAGVARSELLAGVDGLTVVDAAVRDEADAPPAGPIDLDNLAYLIYTSGSTGQPKGVEVSHRALMNLVAWHNGAFGVTAADRATRRSRASPSTRRSGRPGRMLTAGAELHVADEGDREVAVGARRLDGRTPHHRRASCRRRSPSRRCALDWRGASLRYAADGRRPPARLGAGGRAVHARQQLRPDRERRRRHVGHDSVEGPEGVPPPIGRPIAGGRPSTSSTSDSSRCRSACLASSSSAARSLARGYHGRPDADGRALRPRSVLRRTGLRGSTAPAISRDGAPTARSSSSAASIAR